MAKRTVPTIEPAPKRGGQNTMNSSKRIELSVRSNVVAPAAQPHADRRRKDDARQLKTQLRDQD